MEKALIWLNAVVFIVYGLCFVFFPEVSLNFAVQSTLETPSAWTDLRATYGGMSVAVGLVFYLLGRQVQTHVIGLQFVLLLMICMASARVLGMVMHGSPNLTMYIYLSLELFAGIASFWLLRRNRAL